MKRLWISAIAVVILAAAPALAQKPASPKPQPNGKPAAGQKSTNLPPAPSAGYPTVSPGEVKATPEMWFYEQALRQYQDPKMAVRQAAELRADQRQRRLESMKWFGMSNQRPKVAIDPYHTDYSATWVGNNDHYPLRWNGVGQPYVAVRPEGHWVY